MNIHSKVQVVILSISNKNRNVLLLQTNKKRGEFWQNVTGSIEKNEPLIEAARREVAEETGLIYPKERFLHLPIKISYISTKELLVQEQCYFLKLVDNLPDIKIDSHEHQNYRWAPISKLFISPFKYKSNYDCFLKAISYV